MTEQPFTPPEYESEAFNCPLCHAFSHHIWAHLHAHTKGQGAQPTALFRSRCHHCKGELFWDGNSESIILPDVSNAPTVNADVDDHVREAYNEAASIAAKSPRGAAAMLRLSIQHLCKQLDQPGKNLDDDIGALVKLGLPVTIQQALDTVRVIGNESVHPGVIDVRDNPEIVGMLFNLVNTIADQMITQPRRIEDLYGTLPKTKLEGIERRDGKAKTASDEV